MKANELSCKDLMIGDWVMINPISYYQVEQIRMEFGKLRIYLKGTEVFATENEIIPIPITPEILEKNGFYYDENRKAYLMGVIFRVKPERYGLFSFEICGCPYPLNTVHELQHALRLCRIDKTIEL